MKLLWLEFRVRLAMRRLWRASARLTQAKDRVLGASRRLGEAQVYYDMVLQDLKTYVKEMK